MADIIKIQLDSSEMLCTIKLLMDEKETSVYTFPIRGSISCGGFSKSKPCFLLQVLEKGDQYINYILDFKTGEMKRWFDGQVFYTKESFSPDGTSLYYIDQEDENNWVFKHPIGEDKSKRIPLYNLSERHPEEGCQISPYHIIYDVNEETDTVIYTDYKICLDPYLYISDPESRLKITTISYWGGGPLYYRNYEKTPHGIFCINNLSGDKLNFFRMGDPPASTSWRTVYNSDSQFVLDYVPSYDGKVVGIKKRRREKIEWEIRSVSYDKDEIKTEPILQNPNILEIMNIKESRVIAEIGNPRFPAIIAEIDIKSGNITQVLHKPEIPRNIYFPQVISHCLPSIHDSKEVHFFMNIPPLLKEQTHEGRPYILNLSGGPIVAPDDISNLSGEHIKMAQKGIGSLFINYRARHGRPLEDIQTMEDSDGQWNDFHMWDVVTVLKALQESGIATGFVLHGASFDAHTVLSIAQGQEPDTDRFYGEGLNIIGLVMQSGRYLPKNRGEGISTGRHARVKFEDPNPKKIPTIAMHGMKDIQTPFFSEGMFIKNYLERNPRSLFIAEPDAGHQLIGTDDLNNFMDSDLPIIIEKMAFEDDDPFEDFRGSARHQSFIKRYEDQEESSVHQVSCRCIIC